VTAVLAQAYQFDWDVVWDNLGALASGLWITLEVALVGMAIAMVVGLLVAVLRLSASPLLSLPAAAYIQVMRGVPLFVFLFWVYYGLAKTAHLALTPFQAGALALGLTGSAYMAEVYRGGLQAVDPGQREAALAVGLGRGQAFRDVVLPQAVRIIVPPTVNVFVGLLKGATIVSIIGVADMLYLAQVVSLRTFTPFELYTVAGLVLVGVTVAIAGFAFLLERWTSRGARVA
jgi:His/Glu/Gln/Arg/opine family amino acid ABC transporter permease subunit